MRAPMQYPRAHIEKQIREKNEWITTQIERQRKYNERYPMPSEDELAQLTEKAKDLLPTLVMQYAAIMGVNPTGIRITKAQKRFGSCSGKNSLCFSCLLMRYPIEAIEYVVVHELSHIRHHDHSTAFWHTVESYMPDYQTRRAILKGENSA